MNSSRTPTLRGPDLFGVELLLLALVAFFLLLPTLAVPAPARASRFWQHPCRLADPECSASYPPLRFVEPLSPISRNANTNDGHAVPGAIRPSHARHRSWGVVVIGFQPSDRPSA